jgi:hypothetical protein
MSEINTAAVRDEAGNAFPALYQFLSGYFHEDWFEDVTTPEERLLGGAELEADVFKRAVRAYASEGSERCSKVLAEMDCLLVSAMSDQQLGELLSNGFGVSYWPGSISAYRQWLQEVRATLAEAVSNAA